MTAAERSTLITDESAPVAELIDVHKRFGARVVLDGVSLSVRNGETLVLLGRSGTGKSVSLRLLLGLVAPDRGVVRVAGLDVGDVPEAKLIRIRRHVGMVFQHGALFDSMSVEDNVAYGLREHFRWAPARVRERVRECLELVDLHNVERLLPAALSGGMRKRVAIARAIATAPEVLLYDEPTTGLDPATTAQVNGLVRTLQRRLGVTSILVTHDLSSAFTVADRMALLEKGKIAWLGPASEARAAPPEPLARFLGAADDQGDEWKSRGDWP
jgi:phospholipid/cholesterol/gamma-HCH transport system ATP-binding protein